MESKLINLERFTAENRQEATEPSGRQLEWCSYELRHILTLLLI